MVSDLISEAAATKSAIEEAHVAVENGLEASRSAPPAPAPSNAFDGDLFGFDAPAPAPAPLQAPVQSYTAPAPLRAPTQSYSSSYSAEPLAHTQSYASSHSAEPHLGAPSMESTHSHDYDPAPLPGPAPGESYEFAPHGSTPSHQRTMSAVSVGFDSEAIMGGAPAPLPTGPVEPSHYDQNDDGPTPTVENIGELKRKAKEAEDLARDAEESRRQVMAQVNELRRVSDEAEVLARQHATDGEVKKKGFMGRGKKKDAVCLLSSVVFTNVLATE
jgi:hypothetical protein